MKTHTLIRFIPILFFPIFFSGCSNTTKTTSTPPTSNQTQPITIQEVLKGNNVLAFFQNGALSVVDPEFATVLEITQLSPEQTPNRYTLDTFIVSPSHRYIVWFSPQLGILAYDTAERVVKPVHRPTQWFNTNPYMQFQADSDLLYFIDAEGKQLLEYDFTKGQINTNTIPYPFGTMFLASPDKTKFLFISGYRQSIAYPEYLVTTTTSDTAKKFNTQGELSQRTMVAWKKDNETIITLENSRLVAYQTSTGTASSFNAEVEFKNPKSLTVKHDLVYVVDVDMIYIFTMEGKLKARIPVLIAQELNNPAFMPWSTEKFLIEETITTPESSYKRLWISDWRGVKKMIVTKYHEVKTETVTPAL